MNVPHGLVTALVLIACGVSGFLGYSLGRSDAPVIEDVRYLPAVRQADDSLIAERVPDASPPPAPHIIPKGAVEERRIEVTVLPHDPNCEAVRVDLSLIRQGDGRRVIASSRDGRVTAAIDIPIIPGLMPPPRHPWAAGVAYGTEGYLGAWVERDFARLRVGVDAGIDERDKARAVARVGWRFGG